MTDAGFFSLYIRLKLTSSETSIMVDERSSGSGNTAIVAIVVLVLVAILAFFLFFQPSGGGGVEDAGPDVELEVNPPAGGGEGE